MKTLWLILFLCVGCVTTQQPAPEAAPDLNPAHAVSTAPRAFVKQSRAVIAPPLPPIVLLPPHADLSWNASPDDAVVGYNVYYGASSGSYTNAGPSADVAAIIEGLSYGQTYFFAVTAVSDDGTESEFSNEVTFTVPQVLALHFDAVGDSVESSTNLVNWSPRSAMLVSNTFWRVAIDPQVPFEFYRAGM